MDTHKIRTDFEIGLVYLACPTYESYKRTIRFLNSYLRLLDVSEGDIESVVEFAWDIYGGDTRIIYDSGDIAWLPKCAKVFIERVVL